MYNIDEDIHWWLPNLIIGRCNIPIRAHVSDYELISIVIKILTLIVGILTLYKKD